MRAVKAWVLLLLLGASARSARAVGWRAGPLNPTPRGAHVMTFDAARGLIVVYGGGAGVNDKRIDTLEFDGRAWTVGPDAPPAMGWRSHAAGAYDTVRARTVLFGGELRNDTWEYDGLAWLPGPAAPPGLTGRSGHAMAYDASRGRVVLFGGTTPAGLVDDTWEYDGSAWSVGPPAPAALEARQWHAMAFDAARGLVVLFGGTDGVNGLNDTWEFDGTAWSAGSSAPAGLTPRYESALAFDAGRGRMVLFGGYDATGPRNDTWEHDGTSWVAGAAPPGGLWARGLHAMAYDSARRRVVVFGGSGQSFALDDTWEYDGTSWTRFVQVLPPPRLSHAMAYDASRGRAVLFGGYGSWPLADTWECDGAAWTSGPTAPPALRPRDGHTMCFDGARARIVLFGGGNGPNTYRDAWEYDGAAWSSAVGGPPARTRAGMAYDTVRGVTVLHGGCSSASCTTTFGDVWEFDGAIWRPGPAGPVVGGHAMAYDLRRGLIVIFGGLCPPGSCDETWEYDGARWQSGPVTPPALSGRWYHSMAYDSFRGVTVLHGGEDSNAVWPGETWEYDGTGWTLGATTPSTLSGRDSTAMAYHAASRQIILFGGLINSPLNDTWFYGPARARYLLGAGAGPPNPNRVCLHDEAGEPTGVDFLAYAAGAWGANVAAADVDGAARAEILTGPGPGAVFGPHVRGFARGGAPLSKIGFYADGTLRFGVNVAGGDVDADGFEEILTGAGPGGVFGPHVRGFDYDNAAVTALAKLSFFAYATWKFGVGASATTLESDAYEEILTGPGPGPTFAPIVRGFDYDGAAVVAIGKVAFAAFATPAYGCHVAGGDADADQIGEIAASPGAGSTLPPEFRGFDYDGSAIAALPGFVVTPFPTGFGGRLALADVGGGPPADLVAGAGPDSTANAQVKAFRYAAAGLAPLSSFDAFPGYAFGANVAGGSLDP